MSTKPYTPLTVAEIKDMTAMVYGAPCEDSYCEGLVDILAQYEKLRSIGVRPVDPADMSDAERHTHFKSDVAQAAPKECGNTPYDEGPFTIVEEQAAPTKESHNFVYDRPCYKCRMTTCNGRCIAATPKGQAQPVNTMLLEALELLLAKVRRDAPDLSGKLMGECDAAITAAKQAQPEPCENAERCNEEGSCTDGCVFRKQAQPEPLKINVSLLNDQQAMALMAKVDNKWYLGWCEFEGEMGRLRDHLQTLV